MIPYYKDLQSIDKIKKVFDTSYDFPMNGYKLPKQNIGNNIPNLRILETDLIYIVGIPYENSDLDILKSENNIGHYGKISEYHMVKSPIGITNTSAQFQRFDTRLEATFAILGFSIFMNRNTGIKAFYGTNKYCSYYSSKKTCPNKKCLFLHRNVNEGHYFYKDERTENEYHYKLAFSILLHYKEKVLKIYDDFVNGKTKTPDNLLYPSIKEIIETFDVLEMLKNSPSKIITISDNFVNRNATFNKEVNLQKLDVNQQNQKIKAPVCWSEESTPSYKHKRGCDILFEFDEEDKMNFAPLLDDNENPGGNMLLDKLNENTFDTKKSNENKTGSNENKDLEPNYDDLKNISITEKKTKLKETKDISKKDYRSEGEDSYGKSKYKYKNEELNSSSDFENDDDQKPGYCQKNLNAYMRKEKSENQQSNHSDNRSSSSDNGLIKTKGKNKNDPNYNNTSQKVNNIMNLQSNKNNYENISEDIAENVETKISDKVQYIPEKSSGESRGMSMKEKLSKKQSEFSVDSKIDENANNQLIYEPESIMKRNAKFLMTDSAMEILEDHDENDIQDYDYKPSIPDYDFKYDPYNYNPDNQGMINDICNNIFDDDPDFSWYNYRSKVTEDPGVRNTMGFKDDIEHFNEGIVKEERNKQSFLEFFDSKSIEMQKNQTIYNYSGLLDLTNSLGLASINNKKMYSNQIKQRLPKAVNDNRMSLQFLQNEIEDNYILNMDKLLQKSFSEQRAKNEKSPEKKENDLLRLMNPSEVDIIKQRSHSKEQSPEKKYKNMIQQEEVIQEDIEEQTLDIKENTEKVRSNSGNSNKEILESTSKHRSSVNTEEEVVEVQLTKETKTVTVPTKPAEMAKEKVAKVAKDTAVIFENKASKKKRKQAEKKSKKKAVEKAKNEPENVDPKTTQTKSKTNTKTDTKKQDNLPSLEQEQKKQNESQQTKVHACKTPKNEFIDLEKHLKYESNKKLMLEIDELKACTFQKYSKSNNQTDAKITEEKIESNIQTTKEEQETKDEKAEEEADANPITKRKRKKKNKKRQEEQNANDLANDIELEKWKSVKINKPDLSLQDFPNQPQLQRQFLEQDTDIEFQFIKNNDKNRNFCSKNMTCTESIEVSAKDLKRLNISSELLNHILREVKEQRYEIEFNDCEEEECECEECIQQREEDEYDEEACDCEDCRYQSSEENDDSQQQIECNDPESFKIEDEVDNSLVSNISDVKEYLSVFSQIFEKDIENFKSSKIQEVEHIIKRHNCPSQDKDLKSLIKIPIKQSISMTKNLSKKIKKQQKTNIETFDEINFSKCKELKFKEKFLMNLKANDIKEIETYLKSEFTNIDGPCDHKGMEDPKEIFEIRENLIKEKLKEVQAKECIKNPGIDRLVKSYSENLTTSKQCLKESTANKVIIDEDESNVNNMIIQSNKD